MGRGCVKTIDGLISRMERAKKSAVVRFCSLFLDELYQNQKSPD